MLPLPMFGTPPPPRGFLSTGGWALTLISRIFVRFHGAVLGPSPFIGRLGIIPSFRKLISYDIYCICSLSLNHNPEVWESAHLCSSSPRVGFYVQHGHWAAFGGGTFAEALHNDWTVILAQRLTASQNGWYTPYLTCPSRTDTQKSFTYHCRQHWPSRSPWGLVTPRASSASEKIFRSPI